MRETVEVAGRQRLWLRMSFLIAALALIATAVGLLSEETVYAEETANWAAQTVGQDIANLIAYPALAVLALLALRGSLRAHIAWIGVLIYSAYSYAIYAFAINFGPLFLVWVAIFGLSVYTLIGALTSLDLERVRTAYTDNAPRRSASTVLIVIASAFYLLWLAEIIPAAIAGSRPAALDEVGLPTNPIHVLDLALFLPAAVVGGVSLLRRRSLGFVLAPAMLVAMVLLSVGIISLTLVIEARGLEGTPGVAVVIGILTLVELATAIGLLRSVRSRAV